MADDVLENDLTSTVNTRESIVKLATRKVRNQMTSEFNNMIQQEKEVDANAQQNQKKQTETLKAQLECMEALLIASVPSTLHPSIS